METPIPAVATRPTPTARRRLAAAAIALGLLVPSGLAAQNACTASPALVDVGQIASQNGKLQAVMMVKNENRTIPGQSQPTMLRYFAGYNPADPSQKWPLTAGATSPGPTLRAEVGDVVNISLFDQVKVEDFANTLDAGETGRNNGCDQTTKVTSTYTDTNFYPADDKFPNCFHGSSSANLHFHGTHVTPSTTGDNVLINIRPNPKVTAKEVQQWFGQIFQSCKLGQQPQKWEDLPQGYRDFEKKLLQEYDKTAPYVGPGRNPSGHGLPPNLQLWPQNEAAIEHGEWPQWYIGAYPYCFQIPTGRSGLEMGQSPGTHWYHSHKHGSTSINLFNGLAGALIITDNGPEGYDGKLKAFYRGKLEEKVLVFQQFTGLVNLESAAPTGAPAVLVNGQLAPTLTMRPGQVQWWRMINATVSAFVKPELAPAGFTYRQTAQDGVQLDFANYSTTQNTAINLAPANRMDLLVQAPAKAGCYTLQTSGDTPTVYLHVNVTGDPVDPAMGFPTQASDYPPLPAFLADIDPTTIHNRRDIVYNARKAPPDPNNPNARQLVQFTINGKQFEDGIVNESMLLGSNEEWTLVNTDALTAITHPFHIHVNPFQIVEVYSPATMTQPLKLSPPYIWWDTFAVPAPVKSPSSCAIPTVKVKIVENGLEKTVDVCPGYFKFRSRFVDFTGRFVEHCHILAHEDRGMMQLLEVVTNKTLLKHH
jgi:FtsP/CotA-like multicopper oxidase with cupredoxin domain